MNALTKPGAPGAAVSILSPTDMNSAIRLAEMMSSAKTVPQHLQGKPGDCLMVVEQALRFGMSPFAVAQCTSVIQGKLMLEGKLVGAAVQASGILAGRLHYEFDGEGDNRAVTVSGVLKGEAEPRSVRVVTKEVKTTNGMWTKQQDQQLVYSSTRVWARRHVPEVMLGVYSPDEFDPPAAPDTFAGTTIEAEPERGQPQTTAAAIGDEIPALNEGPEYPFQTAKGGRIFRTGAEWAEQWRRTIDACERTAALDKLQSARELNAGAFAAIAEHDAAAVEEVAAALDRALGETAEA